MFGGLKAIPGTIRRHWQFAFNIAALFGFALLTR